MASTAISAQGCTLQIGTGTGGAVTITGVSVGFPTILTINTSTLSNGDVVALSSGFAGTNAASLNGLTGQVIKNKTGTTIAVDVNTTGLTITAGTATATPTTYTQVKNLKSFNGFDGQASEIDVTNLDSSAKEIRLGLVDFGQIQLELDQDNADAGQSAALTAYNAGTGKLFKLNFPNGNVASFTAYVKQFSTAGGVDQVVKRQATLRISGSVTWA